jgi:hypothetical protein
MVYKLIKTDNYLLVVDDSVHPYDSSKVGNPLAHLPLNGSPILEGVDLLPPYSRHQEDGLEDAVIRFKESYIKLGVTDFELSSFSVGYLQAREKYRLTLSKLIDLYVNETGYGMDMWSKKEDETMSTITKIIQSLNQYPTEFECEVEVVGITDDGINTIEEIKTITTAQGVQWVGKYK